MTKIQGFVVRKIIRSLKVPNLDICGVQNLLASVKSNFFQSPKVNSFSPVTPGCF